MDSNYFVDRRSGKERRDWNEFVVYEKRITGERRKLKERRVRIDLNYKPERRKRVDMISSQSGNSKEDREQNERPRYFSTQEVAEMVGISQPTLLLWLQNGLISESTITRSGSGKRLWVIEDIEHAKKIKQREFGS